MIKFLESIVFDTNDIPFYIAFFFLIRIFYKSKKEGIVIFGTDMYLQLIQTQYNIVLFTGKGWGSFKTYTAIVTAYLLLKSGKYERCYSNIPFILATSPPVGVSGPFAIFENEHKPKPTNIINDKKGENPNKTKLVPFDYLADYARDSIFIFDEVWTAFSTYDPKMIQKVFAYPRKMNQLYLMTSVLPLSNFSAFTRGVVTKVINLQPIGIPFLSMKLNSMEDHKTKRKVSKFFIFSDNGSTTIRVFFPFTAYKWFNSKFQPFSIDPIEQYQDMGILYDDHSNPIPPEFHCLFDLDQFNQATRKKNLTGGKATLQNQYYPKAIYSFPESIKEYPNIKKKTKNYVTKFLGTEVNYGMAFTSFLGFWLFISMVYYLLFFAGSFGDKSLVNNYPLPTDSFDNFVSFALLENPKEWEKDTEEKPKPKPNPKNTELTPVEFKRND